MTGSCLQKILLSVKNNNNNNNNNRNNNNKMSPSSRGFCNYSVNCTRGLYEVLLAWRGERNASACKSQAAARGRAPAGSKAVFTSRGKQAPSLFPFTAPNPKTTSKKQGENGEEEKAEKKIKIKLNLKSSSITAREPSTLPSPPPNSPPLCEKIVELESKGKGRGWEGGDKWEGITSF